MAFAWLPETLGILASASLLIALTAILATYDDKAIFYWKGVTLNAVVSVISTASKASMLYSVSQLISQWKWIIFASTTRPLIDFERVDSASRGPMGSLELMWKCKSIAWLRIGALVVLLSIAADPFTQQLIQYKQRVVYTKDMSTSVNRAGRFSKGIETFSILPLKSKFELPPVGSATADADLSIQSSILYGLQQSMKNVVQQVTFSCSTGNCSWPAFESLAVCNKCTNLTASLKRTVSDGSQYMDLATGDSFYTQINDGTAFTLPNGPYLDNLNGWAYRPKDNKPTRLDPEALVWMTTFGTANASETLSAQEKDTLIWSMSIIRAQKNPTNTSATWPDLPVSAIECALFYCINNYETIVSNGTLHQSGRQVTDAIRDKGSWQPIDGKSIDSEFMYKTPTDTFNSIAFDSYFSLAPRTDLMLLSPTSGSRFNISKAAVDSISYNYQSKFASEISNVSHSAAALFNSTKPPGGRFNGFCVNGSQFECKPSIMQSLLSSKDLNATFTALAVSMSNSIRTGADEVFDGVPIGVIGLKGDNTTFYRIVWPWISLHCFIVTFGIIFLGVTIWENQRNGRAVPLWKSSGLAIASRGEAVTDVLSGTQTLGEMWKKAKVSQVTLFGKNDGFGSSLEHLDFDPLEVESQPANTTDGIQ